SSRPKESARRGVHAITSAPGHRQRVCQLWGHPAVAPRGVCSGGALSNPLRHCALPAQGQAEAPQAQPCKKNTAEAADFVKQCPRRLGTIAALGRQAPDQPVRVFCQDESRLGLHLPLHRRLTGSGGNPAQVVEPLYESYWLYAAVEPTTGEAFWWELPSLDAECFGIFLHKFGQAYAESLNIVLL